MALYHSKTMGEKPSSDCCCFVFNCSLFEVESCRVLVLKFTPLSNGVNIGGFPWKKIKLHRRFNLN